MLKSNSSLYFDALEKLYQASRECRNPYELRTFVSLLLVNYHKCLDEFDARSALFSHSSRQAEPATTSAKPK